jgi:apolipoprotein N-acyltransferase
VHVAVVPPNIPQTLKWDERLASQHLLKLISLSRARPRPVRTNTEEDDTRPEPPRHVTHIIWPESAIPSAIDFSARHSVLGEIVPEGGALVTGATRIAGRGPDLKAWNSLAVMNGEGRVVASYDKHHLVPFGEFMPLRGFLPFDKLAVGAVDFSAGPGPRTIAIPGAPPASPLICYEAIFPGEVVDESNRPKWLLNVTNDAWFGISSGPHQHFASARLRAVEEGLPLVRAANTGISAVIDPYGRVLTRLGLDQAGVIDAPLPAALTPTPFAIGGNLIPLALGAVLAGAAFLPRRP